MSTTEAPFSFTTKVNGDLLTVRGEDYAAFVANLGFLVNVPQIASLVDVLSGTATVPFEVEQEAIATIAAAAGGATVISAPAVINQPVQPQTFAPVAPPVQQTAPQGQTPACQHGPMKLVPGGISKKTGKPYNAFWACQWPTREEQCRAVSVP